MPSSCVPAVRVLARGHAGIVRRARHDRGAQHGMGCEHPVKADPMQARTRHQRCEPLQLIHVRLATPGNGLVHVRWGQRQMVAAIIRSVLAQKSEAEVRRQ